MGSSADVALSRLCPLVRGVEGVRDEDTLGAVWWVTELLTCWGIRTPSIAEDDEFADPDPVD